MNHKYVYFARSSQTNCSWVGKENPGKQNNKRENYGNS